MFFIKTFVFRVFPVGILVTMVFLLQSCLYTIHHFNTGEILDPGETSITIGGGGYRLYNVDCPGQGYYMNDSIPQCVSYSYSSQNSDTTRAKLTYETVPKFSLGYRLGVRKDWGPFPGVEIGWHMEAPTLPGSVEMDFKLGMPVMDTNSLSHSVSAGWIIGFWSDNTWFGEYAITVPWKTIRPFASYRLSYLATQLPDHQGIEDKLAHTRRWVHQMTGGGFVSLGEVPILPDFLVPIITLTWPEFKSDFDSNLNEIEGVSIGWNINLGMGWSF